MARNDPFLSDHSELFPKHASPITNISDVTPSSNEVSVQTESVDQGEVHLLDTNGNILDRVAADSGAWQDSTSVDGTTITDIRLVGAADSFSSETISVNDDTGGNGTTTTADVNSDAAEHRAFFDGSAAANDVIILSFAAGSFNANLFIENSNDSGSNWVDLTQLVTDQDATKFEADWQTQFNRIMLKENRRRLRVENIDTTNFNEGFVAIDGDER